MKLLLSSNALFLAVTLLHLAYAYNPPGDSSTNRRAFVSTVAATTVGGAWCLASQEAQALSIKVTPIAHTFVSSDGANVKPLRENDATRFLTNAKVVYMLEGKEAKADLAPLVLQLTTKRKADQGAGVTPGKLHVVSSSKEFRSTAEALGLVTDAIKDASASTIAALATKLPVGDTLIVGPTTSGGTATDGKLVVETAMALGVAVGGAREGGVLSILLDGPRADVVLEENGYPISTILWYHI
jgi:hypothetical protein